MLPLGRGTTQAKLLAPTRQLDDTIESGLLQFKQEAQVLVQQFRDLNLKKKEKLPDHSTQAMRRWLDDHFAHPYPSPEEKLELKLETGLSIKQINQWFINARVRIWRPAVRHMMANKSEI